jgi:hypothetical protein
MAFVWFALLLKQQAPLFNNFETFLKNFNASFGDLDKERTSNIKIQSFCQRSCLSIVYASKFKQLANVILWGEITFISQF